MDEKDSPEHLQFMKELVDNVQKMIGDSMLACAGDEHNGVYVIVIGTQPMPSSIVMACAVSMLAKQHSDYMGQAYNEQRVRTSGPVN